MNKISLLFTFTLYNVVIGNYIRTENSDSMAAIVNGYDAPNRPFYVKLRIANGWLCGGTIISSRYVLTAAHCLVDKPSNNVLVFVGDFTHPGERNKQAIPASGFKIHEGFRANGNYPDDIALIELSRSVSSSYALPLCDKNYNSYTIGVCGLGDTNPSYKKPASVLQEVRVKERANCAISWSGPQKQVCVGDGLKGSCIGDSGGPMYPMDNSASPICLYGIVSYGSEHCNTDAVYTRVSAYHDWIQKNTR